MIMAYRTVAIYHGIKKIYSIIEGHSQPQSLMVQLKGIKKSQFCADVLYGWPQMAQSTSVIDGAIKRSKKILPCGIISTFGAKCTIYIFTWKSELQ